MEKLERLGRRSPSTIPTRGLAIGIDLGTTYSSVGVFRNGKVEIVTNDLGNKRTPSLVAFTESRGLVIGEAAVAQRFSNASNTVFDAKRLLGRRFDDTVIQEDIKHWPFQVINEKGWPKIHVNFRGRPSSFMPERVSSMLLIKLRGMAEAYLGETVTDAVITVPAHFNEYQKQATKDAAKFAGLGVMRILKESAATAMAYKVLQGHNATFSKEEHNVLIFDLGGGSFDVSVLSIHDSVLEVKSTGGNTHLGGEDFDNRLANYIVSEFIRLHSKDPTGSRIAMERLRAACEKAKRTLSDAHLATIDIDSFFEDIDLHFTVNRATFEEICSDYFAAVTQALRKAVRDAKLEKHMIHEVILVGGCSNMPRIQELIQDMFPGKELNKWLNAMDAVAYGAALQAGIMTHDSQILESMLLLDVTPHPLGIETAGGIMSFVVKGDSAIPTRLSRSFTTCNDNQIAATIKVYEGSRPCTKENNLLGIFTFNGLPSLPAGQVRIDVTFNVDADGTLEVSATHKASSKKTAIIIAIEKEQLLEGTHLKQDELAEFALVEYQQFVEEEGKKQTELPQPPPVPGQKQSHTPPQQQQPPQKQQSQKEQQLPKQESQQQKEVLKEKSQQQLQKPQQQRSPQDQAQLPQELQQSQTLQQSKKLQDSEQMLPQQRQQP